MKVGKDSLITVTDILADYMIFLINYALIDDTVVMFEIQCAFHHSNHLIHQKFSYTLVAIGHLIKLLTIDEQIWVSLLALQFHLHTNSINAVISGPRRVKVGS
jgi:hypothetical protein